MHMIHTAATFLYVCAHRFYMSMRGHVCVLAIFDGLFFGFKKILQNLLFFNAGNKDFLLNFLHPTRFLLS